MCYLLMEDIWHFFHSWSMMTLPILSLRSIKIFQAFYPKRCTIFLSPKLFLCTLIWYTVSKLKASPNSLRSYSDHHFNVVHKFTVDFGTCRLPTSLHFTSSFLTLHFSDLLLPHFFSSLLFPWLPCKQGVKRWRIFYVFQNKKMKSTRKINCFWKRFSSLIFV